MLVRCRYSNMTSFGALVLQKTNHASQHRVFMTFDIYFHYPNRIGRHVVLNHKIIEGGSLDFNRRCRGGKSIDSAVTRTCAGKVLELNRTSRIGQSERK